LLFVQLADVGTHLDGTISIAPNGDRRQLGMVVWGDPIQNATQPVKNLQLLVAVRLHPFQAIDEYRGYRPVHLQGRIFRMLSRDRSLHTPNGELVE
jgi:hypothetical protein